MLLTILVATILISALSLISVSALSLKESVLKEFVKFIVALSAGTMIGAAFLHLLPESAETLEVRTTFLVVLLSFVAFFVIEKVIHWHHCHQTGKHIHAINTAGHMNLIGDALHNFLDGLIIAAAFIVDFRLGLVTSLAVVLHEIPQEIGDFGVLIYSGWSKVRAIRANLLIALTMVLGGITGYFLVNEIAGIIPYITAFAAGGFIYISTTDLVPELRRENDLKKSFAYLACFMVGILIMYLTQ